MSESEKLGPTLPFKETLLKSCQEYGVKPKTEIGQHLLIDEEVIKQMANLVPKRASVIEIGAGPGQLTKPLLEKTRRMVTIEIDKQFAPFLNSLQRRYPTKLEVIYGNALKQNWRRLTEPGRKERVWLIGSLPYHITEPLMATIATLPIEGVVFLVGAKFASEIRAAGENSSNFGKLTLLVNTFFHTEVISKVGKSCFWPKPRTDSVIITLTPREESEFSDKALFILRELFLGVSKSPLVKNALKEALIKYEKSSDRRMTQNQARAIIATLNLSTSILNKPLEQLNNQELREFYDRFRENFEK